MILCLSVFRIRIRLDPFNFGQPDPDSKKSAKIMENFYKNQPKWKDYVQIRCKNEEGLLNDWNSLLIL